MIGIDATFDKFDSGQWELRKVKTAIEWLVSYSLGLNPNLGRGKD